MYIRLPTIITHAEKAPVASDVFHFFMGGYVTSIVLRIVPFLQKTDYCENNNIETHKQKKLVYIRNARSI